jgi:signal transduction histidine kinase
VSQALDAVRHAAAVRLLDSMLHDVRNPLNALSINLDVLTEKLRGPDGIIPPTQEKNLKAMREQVLRVDAVLRQFVEFMAPRAAEASRGAPLSDTVSGALVVLGHELRKKRLSVSSQVEPGVRVSERRRGSVGTLVLQALLRAIDRSDTTGAIEVAVVKAAGGAQLRVKDSSTASVDPMSRARVALEGLAEEEGIGLQLSGQELVIHFRGE